MNDLFVPGDLRGLERLAVDVDHLLLFRPFATGRASGCNAVQTVDVDGPGVGGRNELSCRDGRCGNQRRQVERPERPAEIGPERNPQSPQRFAGLKIKQIN